MTILVVNLKVSSNKVFWESLTCHPAVQKLCWAPDEPLVVISNGTLRHGPVDVVELVAVVGVLHSEQQPLLDNTCLSFISTSQKALYLPPYGCMFNQETSCLPS